MKEEESFDRVLNRLVIDRDSIFRPQDPRGRIAHDSTIDADSPRTDPFLARSTGSNSELREQPIYGETFRCSDFVCHPKPFYF
jgi:hypothetical protein